jgi:hypothetical protein
MPFILAAAENFLLIVALPWLLHDGARDFVARLDNRSMFSIPFCRSLAIACGGLLAIATALLAGIAGKLSPAALWDITGFWHEGRFIDILAVFAGELSQPQQSSFGLKQVRLTQILIALAAALTAVNFVIAVLGWRSAGALRGMIAHCLIAISMWIILTIGALAAFWVVHWLNFWVLLVVTIVVEMRRREEGVTKLSF